jgi:hypothetical protein
MSTPLFDGPELSCPTRNPLREIGPSREVPVLSVCAVYPADGLAVERWTAG